MLWVSKTVDIRRLKSLWPDATIQQAPLYCAYGHEEAALLVTFPTLAQEDAARAKLQYDPALQEDVLQEERQ